MALQEEFVESGNWFFRHRSYVPLILIIPMMLAMIRFHRPLDSHRLHERWEFFCMAVSFSGLAIRAFTVGHTPARTSGRNTLEQIAAQVNTTGAYSLVRHPLYVGNFVIWLGISMFCLEWWLVTIFALAFWMYYERIMFAEEDFLRKKFGDDFQQWAAVTPAVVPNFSRWHPPSLPFSLRNVLKREYTAFFAIIACFFVLELIEDAVVEHALVLDPEYLVIGSLGLATFLVLRTLKRHTNVLSVEGR